VPKPAIYRKSNRGFNGTPLGTHARRIRQGIRCLLSVPGPGNTTKCRRGQSPLSRRPSSAPSRQSSAVRVQVVRNRARLGPALELACTGAGLGRGAGTGPGGRAKSCFQGNERAACPAGSPVSRQGDRTPPPAPARRAEAARPGGRRARGSKARTPGTRRAHRPSSSKSPVYRRQGANR